MGLVVTRWARPGLAVPVLQMGPGGSVRLAAGSGALAGFADATNTGHTAWPGYTGSLTTYSGPDPIPSSATGTTYEGLKFAGGVTIGSAGSFPSSLTFRGCLFETTAQELPNVQDYGTDITYEYCTFRPAAVSAPPVSLAQSYQFGVAKSGQGLTVRYCHFWGFGEAISLDQSSQTHPVLVEHSYMHDCADQAGSTYHHDGILSNNGGSNMQYITIHHNTIVSGGNTNAIALQVDSGTPRYYSNITVTGNLVGGFGATVNVGGNGAGNSNVVFTDNTLTTLIQPVFFELYGWTDSSGNLWRRNRWYVPPGAAYGNPADSGKYWTPSGVSTTDWTG